MPQRFLVVSVVAFVAVVLAGPAALEARPKYRVMFEKTYPNYQKVGRKVSCALCHPTEKKTDRNHYGQALEKELKAKNVADEKLILEAIKAIEKHDCKSGNFGERIKKLQVPCECKFVPKSVVERLLDTQ